MEIWCDDLLDKVVGEGGVLGDAFADIGVAGEVIEDEECVRKVAKGSN